jgi:hypothetical protein
MTFKSLRIAQINSGVKNEKILNRIKEVHDFPCGAIDGVVVELRHANAITNIGTNNRIDDGFSYSG